MSHHTTKAIEKWRCHIVSQQRSGLSPRMYCRSRGIDFRTFRRWRNEYLPSLESEEAGLELREAGLELRPDARPSGSSGVCLAAGRVLVHVSPGFDRGTLAAVLDVLGGLQC